MAVASLSTPQGGLILEASGAAARLGLSKDWFLRARSELERGGFPPPLALPVARFRKQTKRGRPPLRWSAAAIDAWIAAQAPAALRPFMGFDAAANENAPEASPDKARAAAAKIETRLL